MNSSIVQEFDSEDEDEYGLRGHVRQEFRSEIENETVSFIHGLLDLGNLDPDLLQAIEDELFDRLLCESPNVKEIVWALHRTQGELREVRNRVL